MTARETTGRLEGAGARPDLKGVKALPGDPVGDCLVASAYSRVNALDARYREHSQRLADGKYVEQLPWVATTVAALPVVSAVVHSGT